MAENSGGWGSLYNSGTGIQGGFGGTSTEYSTWSALLSAMQADDGDADNSPKIYVYTGPDITLGETEVVNITGLNRKTIYANAGQTISRGELRFVQCDDIIIRNWSRRGPFYPTGTGAGEAELDYFTFNECNGIWVHHADLDAEFQYSGAGDQYPDGMIDTNLSNYIVVSETRIWNGQRGMLIGYSDTQTANNGLLNTTFRNNWVKNIGGRGPKCRFGEIDIYNNYFTNDPLWSADWSPLNKPTGQHFPAHGAGAQLWMRNNYCEEGQSLVRDDDGGNDTSGVIFDGNFIGDYDFTGGTVTSRAYNVTWDPTTEPGYVMPTPLKTPTEAKAYAEKWAGATYHLIRTLTVSVTGSGVGNEISSGPYAETDTVEVQAVPDTGQRFLRWEVDSVSVSTSMNYQFAMPANDVEVVAIFEADPKLGTLLFEEDWETGTLTNWNIDGEIDTTAIPGSGSSVISTDYALSLGNSLRMRSDNDAGQTNNFRYGEPSNNTEILITYYFYFPELIDLADNFDSYFNLMQFKGVNVGGDNRNDPLWVFGLNVRGGKGTGGANYIGLGYLGQFWPELGQAQYDVTPETTLDIPLAKWFKFQIRYKRSDSAGIIQAWQDDVLLFEVRDVVTHPTSLVDNIFTSVNNYGEQRLPNTSTDFTDVYLDNVQINLINGSYDFGDTTTYTLTTQVNSVLRGTITEVTTGPYEAGDTVTVSASANSGFVFGEFASDQITNSGDNPHSFLMPAQNVTVTAMFYPTYDLTLAVDPSGFGTVDGSPDGPYQEDEVISLTATPGAGNQFDGWYDGATFLSAANPYNYTMPASDKTITGQFSATGTTYTVTLTANDTEMGSVTEVTTGPYEAGDTVTVEATANPGYVFRRFESTQVANSELNSYSFTMPAENVSIEAIFEIPSTFVVRRFIF